MFGDSGYFFVHDDLQPFIPMKQDDVIIAVVVRFKRLADDFFVEIVPIRFAILDSFVTGLDDFRSLVFYN